MATIGQPGFAELLRAVPVFAGLPDEMRHELADGGRRVSVPAGNHLFRQGEEADALYVVLSGRLEAVVEDGHEVNVLRVLTRGAVLGELGILTGSPRSASVVARRDSELLGISRDHFEELLAGHPGFAVALTRELGSQLRESRRPESTAEPVPAVVGLVPFDPGVPMEELAAALLSELGGHHDVLRIDPPAPGNGALAELGAALNAAQERHTQVVLVATDPSGGDPWTSFCIREADRVIGVCGGGPPPAWIAREASLRGCDVAFCDFERGAVRTGPWLDPVEPRAVHLLPPGGGRRGAVARLARRLAGRSVGVVLSGGGARAFAHIGVLEELAAQGVVVDRLAGCSMGAFISGLFATGRSPDDIRAHCHEEFVAHNPLDDYTVPMVSLIRGRRARQMVERSFGDVLIEELEREYFCVSCDLVASELVVHRRGTAWLAIGASMSLPAILPPIAFEHRLLVDGGVLNNLPVELMASRGEGPVIAVDVSSRFERSEGQSRFTRPRARALAERLRGAVVGDTDPLPGIGETLMASMMLGSIDTVEAAGRHADLVIAPEVSSAGLLEWAALDRMRESGRRAAHEALERAPASVSAFA
jgi:NTE family protein